MVAVATHTDPDDLVPFDATFRFSISAFTVAPDDTVGVPMSRHHSCHAKLPSPDATDALNVATAPDTDGNVESITWNHRFADPDAACKSV